LEVFNTSSPTAVADLDQRLIQAALFQARSKRRRLAVSHTPVAEVMVAQ